MTDAALPPPPLPATVDLTDYDWMPLDVRRLRDSETASKTSPLEFRAAVMLWCASWHQVPASSLPDDDAELAKLAGYGQQPFSAREFRKVKAGALRGFMKHSDGRLYHQIIAQKAVTSWVSKLEQRYRSECARVKKWNQRHDEKLPDPPQFGVWITCEHPESAYLMSLGTRGNVPKDKPDCPERQGEMSLGTLDPSEVRGSSSINHHRVLPASGLEPAVDNPGRAKPGKSTPKAHAPRWWQSDQGWIEEGRRHGIEAGIGESPEAFKMRVRAAREKAKHDHERAQGAA